MNSEQFFVIPSEEVQGADDEGFRGVLHRSYLNTTRSLPLKGFEMTIIHYRLYTLTTDDMISIIIPYYNHKNALEATLRSIATQTGVHYEVIIVDDGSEESVDMTTVQQIVTPIRLVRHKENKGAPAARNTGLREAKGRYIIFWDADVVAVPDMLMQMKEVLDTQTDIDFVYSNFVFGPKTFRLRPFSLEALKQRNYIHSTSLVRRSVAPFWDESLKKLQDWDYWLTIAEHGGTGYWIDAVLFTVGQRKEGMSRWIPSFAYRVPFRWLPFFRGQVERYTVAERIVKEKHSIQ